MLLSRLKAHESAVNAIATLPGSRLFVTGGADSVIKIWKLPTEEQGICLIHSFPLKPRYIPLSIAIGDVGIQDGTNSVFVAIGGTRNSVQIYAMSNVTAEEPTHSLQATLTGHESWITSLALKRTGEHGQGPDGDVWLASASQDKSVRLWRLTQNDTDSKRPLEDEFIAEQALTGKIHEIRAGSISLSITFEALLLGHEDWIYTASWDPQPRSLRLLTASADNSLIIWEPEVSSGIWVSSSRLGEISGQKGAISATGSTGGFWMGLWSPDAGAVTCLGKSGSWRLWQYEKDRSYWIQKSSLTGHTKAVTDLSWTNGGEYLLSASSDQTTRLHAEWQSQASRSWHEFARPQIHGYDLNCVQSLSSTRFVSGADEKLLRVFDQPRNVAEMLERLCGIGAPDEAEGMPEAANLPVLGLSNKAITLETDDEVIGVADDDIDNATVETVCASHEPPTEDFLSRHTLWPEHEKLYGHGHEISALAANSSGTIISTACKSSSIEHAVIRLYDTKDWHEIRPPLTAHSLTIARLQFRLNNDILLSVGRDRQWGLFKPGEIEKSIHSDGKAPQNYALIAANPKGHSRMILDAAWSPNDRRSFFATAGRDKTVKIWAPSGDKLDDYTCRITITRRAPVTAIDFNGNSEEDIVCLAVGEETGRLSYHIISADAFRKGGLKQVEPLKSIELEERFCPSKAVTRLAWRPRSGHRWGIEAPAQLAIASADTSLRILSISWQDQKAQDMKRV
jgi:elongator complex protein 2